MQHDLPLAPADSPAKTVHAVRPGALDAFLAGLDPAGRDYLAATGFKAESQSLVLLPGDGGIGAAVLGLGEDRSPFAYGDLPFRLPDGAWRIAAPSGEDDATATLGFLLGAYRFRRFKPPRREPARLIVAQGHGRALSEAGASWMVRDLVNTPANLLGPAELADAACDLASQHGAAITRTEGQALDREYPTIAAVGRGSARPPVVAGFAWRGSGAADDAPLVSLCGKGVCFDTGGHDLKPSAGMLRMKKDMGGAATVLGIARIVMEADLPLRLAVRIGCVENSVSGTAMRPLDVLTTRSGKTVEIGNTDAEGRLVLCDLLAEAVTEHPAVLIDCATLTGAARVALGPDLPALFCSDESWAGQFLQAGRESHDPLWRLPLWDGYDSWLDSPVADFNNVTSKPGAGAITAALFLRRFVPRETPWAHLDLYAWSDSSRPGRPEGGEAQAIRGICAALESKLFVTSRNQNALLS